MTRTLRLALAGLVVAFFVGCGNSEPTAAKETLSDKDKEQLKQLNQQRQDEWGSTNKKK
jgi:hypothetical protein